MSVVFDPAARRGPGLPVPRGEGVAEAGTGAGLVRVTVSAPHRRIDVALPGRAPLIELLPDLLRHAGEGLADDGERHGGWLLRRADGSALGGEQGLLAQGVRDGEVLHLVPARAEWPELEYDDVVEAMAEGARRRGAAWGPPTTRVAALAGAGVPLAAVLATVVTRAPLWSAGAALALGVALLLTVCGVAASRAYGDAVAGAVLGGYALPFAFVGGLVLVGGGAPGLLVGSAMLLLASVVGAVGVATCLPVFAAGVTVGLLGALTALAGFALPPAGAAAVLVAALVGGIGVLPLLAIRLGKLPMPPVALPTGGDGPTDFTGPVTPHAALEAARDRPAPERVHAAVARAEQLLTGMLIGYAALAAAAILVLGTAGGVAAPLLAGLAAAALLLRSRLFVAVRHRAPLLAAGLTGAGGLLTGVLTGSGPAGSAGAAVLVVLLALVVAVAGVTWSRRPPSPYLGRAGDLAELVVVVSVVPVACAVLGLYARLRGLAG